MPPRQVCLGRASVRRRRPGDGRQSSRGRHARRDPGPRAPLPRRAPCSPSLRSRTRSRPLRRPGVRRGGAGRARRLEPGLLPHRQPVHRGVRGRVRRLSRPVRGAAGQLGLVGQPGRAHRAHVAQAGRPPAAAGRRGHHGRGRFSQHGRADHPERADPGVRGRSPGRLQRRSGQRCARRSRPAPGRSCWRTRWAPRTTSTP